MTAGRPVFERAQVTWYLIISQCGNVTIVLTISAKQWLMSREFQLHCALQLPVTKYNIWVLQENNGSNSLGERFDSGCGFVFACKWRVDDSTIAINLPQPIYVGVWIREKRIDIFWGVQ